MQFAPRRTRFLNPLQWFVSIATRLSMKGMILGSSPGKLSCHQGTLGRPQELISVLHNLHHHECLWNYLLRLQILFLERKPRWWGGGIVNGVISLIFLLAVAAQRVPHAKPQSTCTYSWQKSCGFAGFPLGFCLLFRHPPEHVTVGLLGSLRLFRVIRTTLHTNKTAFNCVEMSDKTTLSLEMKAAYGSTEVTEQRQETSKIGLTSWTLGWLLW